MQLDNIRVSRKLWFAFLGLMVAMALVSGIAQNRGNTTMARAMDAVVDIDTRVVAAVRWRGGTETAVNMIMGGAVTTDAVLAQQYDARVKEIVGDINKIQETIVAGATAPEEKAAIDKVVAERKLVLEAVAKTWELKGAGDAVETQRFADEQLTPMVARYLKAQDEFIAQLERRREAVREEAMAQRIRSGVISTLTALVVFAAGALLAWLLVRSITAPLQQAVDTANAIAAGDLTRELQTSRKDELGQMLRALNDMSARLRGVVSEVRQGVDSVSSASIQIANGNHDLSARTEQTAANLEETASSMEELTATVTQSADTARQANQLAANAAQAATRGGQVVGQVVASMQQVAANKGMLGGVSRVAATVFDRADTWAYQRMKKLGADPLTGFALHQKMLERQLLANAMPFDPERMANLQALAQKDGQAEEVVAVLKGIRPETLATHGAVSEDIAAEMAAGALARSQAASLVAR